MVITRMDWRLHGDLLEYLALKYPGRSAAAYEAAFRLLAHDPDMGDEAGDRVELLLAGCVVATEREEA